MSDIQTLKTLTVSAVSAVSAVERIHDELETTDYRFDTTDEWRRAAVIIIVAEIQPLIDDLLNRIKELEEQVECLEAT